jgi:hypothetical protein
VNGTAFILAAASVAVLVVAGLAHLWSKAAPILGALSP